jgi:hypothetical protein
MDGIFGNVGTNLKLARFYSERNDGKNETMRNLVIVALSIATAISGTVPAYAMPARPATASAGALVVPVVDQGHDWKHNLQDDPIPQRRHDNRHHNDHHRDYSHNDRYYYQRNDHHHHNHIGEIIGGAAAGALIGGALAPQRRVYDDPGYYDDGDY